ncbi:MAG: heparinase II/III family protein [Candidatus Latescibacterota bacterium]|nr:heparinase II/III family protein [Candidatus Latescibacterota bacterium]
MATIQYPREQLMDLLSTPGDPLIPLLDDAIDHPEKYRDRTSTKLLFEQGAEKLADIENISHLTYTTYRNVQRFTDSLPYKTVGEDRRTKMALAAMKVILGNEDYLNLLHDYVWVTCEETNWMLPQLDHVGIELRVAATALSLAEIIVGLSDKMEDKAKNRVRQEIEDRVFTPYLRHPNGYHWYKGTNNWNGVINSSIGCSFLLLEKDTERLARALEIVLVGLDAFLEIAFEPDGSSAEGTGYWMYGLSNFICFSEMLQNRTLGEIDLLGTDRLKQIAHYPIDVLLSPGHYFPYSDCRENVGLEPGLVTRLIERTGFDDLRGVIADPAGISMGLARFHTAWRNTFWWDGVRPDPISLDDIWLKESDVVRLVSSTAQSAPITLATKAGHNGVSHNHNDIGSFVLHVDGETLLCDPESGLYDLYRRHGHDQNLFANSLGHSVPKIGDTLQSRGKEFGGHITSCDMEGDTKRVEMEITGAYDIPELKRLQRTITLKGNMAVIEDHVSFNGDAQNVEEALVVWIDPTLDGATARIAGERHQIELTIEEPSDATWSVESFEEESKANNKQGILKRLSFNVSGESGRSRIRVRILAQSKSLLSEP